MTTNRATARAKRSTARYRRDAITALEADPRALGSLPVERGAIMFEIDIRRPPVTRVLLIGYAPDAVDFSDAALPPGMDAGKIAAGIELGLKQMRDRGWEADFCSVRPDETAAPTVARTLASAAYDCVVIGGGVRLATKSLAEFEAIINAVREGAPGTPIAFNTRPDDSADAAARWLPGR